MATQRRQIRHRSRSLSLPVVWLGASVAALAGSAGCSQEDSTGPEGSNPNGSDNPASGGATDPGGDATGGVAMGGSGPGVDPGTEPDPTAPPPVDGLPTLRPTRIRIPDPIVSSPPCAQSGDGQVGDSTILLGQTHLHPSGHPFATISADRPLSIAVDATGSDVAPSMTVTAFHDEGEVGTVCLTGPSQLLSAPGDLEANAYRAALPAAWVKEGLRLQVQFGAGAPEEVAVDVKPPNFLTVYFVDAMLFGDGEAEPYSEDLMIEFLARLPVSYLDVGHNPFGTWSPTEMLVDERSDGRSPTGETQTTPPVLVTEYPHCDDADKSAGTCTPHAGFGQMSSVLDYLSAFMEANGLGSSSTWYADLSRSLGGGLGGGQRGTGDNMALVMNHELGHAWGFPHWGASHTEYPYSGETVAGSVSNGRSISRKVSFGAQIATVLSARAPCNEETTAFSTARRWILSRTTRQRTSPG